MSDQKMVKPVVVTDQRSSSGPMPEGVTVDSQGHPKVSWEQRLVSLKSKAESLSARPGESHADHIKRLSARPDYY